MYNVNYDGEIVSERQRVNELCFEYNLLKPSQINERQDLMKKILKKTKENFTIMSPFYYDLGNIEIGENFYANYNCIILDEAKVTFGDNVFIAPNCCFSTADHPLDIEQRNQVLEYAYPIHVGDNVWIGANVIVLPGVTISSGSIIGAGAVVNKDIPEGVIAVGNPCHVFRKSQKKTEINIKISSLQIKICMLY